MKAVAVFPGEKKVQIIDHEEPRMDGPHDVKLQMLDVGICGTDREICEFEYGTPPAGSPYLVLGHESLGRVLETGSLVTDLEEGDLVVPMVRRPCPHDSCTACRGGRQDFCFTGDFTERGIKEHHGFMTEFVVDERQYMSRVPASLREVAVLVEPLTIAEKAMAQVWDVQERLPWACPIRPEKPEASDANNAPGTQSAYCHSALILGAGPVGLLGAMAIAAQGFETFVYSREPMGGPRSRIVQAIGGQFLSAQDFKVEDLTGRIGDIDLVYEATGASGLSFQMLQHLAANAVFVFTGVPGRKAPIEVDAALIMRNLVLKNQVVFGTVNAGAGAYDAAVRDLELFMKRWPDAVRALVSGRFPMQKHDDLIHGRAGGIKNIIAVTPYES